MVVATSTALLISAGVAAAGTVASISQQKKAARASQRQQQLQAQRSQRQALREQQIRRAQMQAQAQALGASGGSAVLGGMSSLSSQLGSAVGYAGQQSGLSSQITMASQRAQTAGSIAGLGMTAFQGLGGFDMLAGGQGGGNGVTFPKELLQQIS